MKSAGRWVVSETLRPARHASIQGHWSHLSSQILVFSLNFIQPGNRCAQKKGLTRVILTNAVIMQTSLNPALTCYGAICAGRTPLWEFKEHSGRAVWFEIMAKWPASKMLLDHLCNHYKSFRAGKHPVYTPQVFKFSDIRKKGKKWIKKKKKQQLLATGEQPNVESGVASLLCFWWQKK